MKTETVLITGIAILTIQPRNTKTVAPTTIELIAYVSPADKTPGEITYALITHLWEKGKKASEVLQNHINSLSVDTSVITLKDLKVFDTKHAEISRVADSIRDIFPGVIKDRKKIKELKPKN